MSICFYFMIENNTYLKNLEFDALKQNKKVRSLYLYRPKIDPSELAKSYDHDS